MTQHESQHHRTRVAAGLTAFIASIAATSPASADNAADESTKLEVIVTAQKREERLLDVPVPVTAVSAETLTDYNQLRLQDYFSNLPGFNVTPSAQSYQQLSIRGITTGPFTNPTVGVVVDDVPFGAATSLAGASAIPDIDPGDLARVEVLRGPQGTLYGASSMGGLLKFVTADPSTDSTTGRLSVGTSSVRNGDDLGYNVRGSANVPLSDTFAVRASGFTRKDPGYVDNPVLGVNGINWGEVRGGHVAALWRASDVLSLKFSALYQSNEGGGTSDGDPSLGDLKQSFVAGVGPYDRKVQAYSVTLNADLGAVDLTSISGYNVNNYHDTSDYTVYLGDLTEQLYGVRGLALFNHVYSKKFSQEVRLASAPGRSFEWLVGAFYTDEDSQFHSDAYAVDPLTGTRVVDALIGTDPLAFTEYAAFGNITYHFTDTFDVQFGGREGKIKQSAKQTQWGPYVPLFYQVDPPYDPPEASSDNNVFTYLVTPRYKVSDDVMVYARLASGYRAGGLNISLGTTTPQQFDSDKTRNYEIGLKGEFLDKALSVDASVYYIDWKDLQIGLVDQANGAQYTGNGSRARSQGIELSVRAQPTSGLTVAAWVSVGDSKLTEDFPLASTTHGESGDRLPFSSRWSGNLSLEQSFSLSNNATGFVGGTLGYVGNRRGLFTGTTERQEYPGYAEADLHAGVTYDLWTVNLFVNNVTDRRGEIGGGLGSFPPNTFYYVQPRTVGALVSKSF